MGRQHRRGSCAEENAGWEDRLRAKAVAGSVAGIGAGLVLSATRHRPVLSTTALTGINVAVASGVFGLFQETFRMLTCRDSPLNSVFAGGCAGYLLGFIQHGRGKGPPVASFTFAALGGVCHHLDDRGFNPAPAVRGLLESLDLIDGGCRPAENQSRQGDDGGLKWFERWLPIRKLTEEEYDNVKRQQELKEAYGTGCIDPEYYNAEISKLQHQAAMMKHRRNLTETENERTGKV